MIVKILWIFLIILGIYIVYNTKTPKVLIEVQEKYSRLRNHIQNSNDIPTNFKVLKTQIPISGFLRSNGELGYNINKGGEIGLCLDGNSNDVFHVLIHELAHSASSKYSHDEEFWNNYNKLKTMCRDIGIYKEIPEKRKFCGAYIQD
jgi:hypothetical protein